jgi:hypothetical protein
MSRVRVRGWWLLPIVAATALLMPWPSALVENLYSRRVYQLLQASVTRVSNLTGLAIIDGLLIFAAALLVWWAIRLFRSGSGRGVVSRVWEVSRRLVRTVAVIVLLFVALWGLNYRRVPLETTLGGGIVDPQRLLVLAESAAMGANATRPAAVSAAVDFDAVAARLAPAFAVTLERLGLPGLLVPGRPKHSGILTPFFTAAGVTGMVNPLALESIVHPELLPFERPMVLAHEWAHLAGFADEADASALAWAVCRLGDPALHYSAHMFVILETASALPAAGWQQIRARLEPGVVDDLRALAARLTRQQPVVRQTAFRVYDGYLKSNSVEDGVRSYSRVLRVLLTPGMQALAPDHILSSSSRSSGVIGLEESPVRRSSGSASGPSVSGR